MRTFLQYMQEVRQPELKKIGRSLNKFNRGDEELHLDNIFGTNKRIAFPIGNAADSRITAFMDELKELGVDLSVDDLKKGIVTTQIQTQRGTQERQLRLANYLNGLKREGKDAAKIDKLVQDWSVIKDRLSTMDMGSSYSVVVSRYPLDILRMSDHVDDDGGEIESCHSPDGGWYHCAIKEAHIGGAVAYAVKTSDLAKVDLQAKEIFRDKDRAVEGIFPLERVRLRRFHDERKKLDILVPEIRTYPMKNNKTGIKKVPGFHEAVVAWAKKAQARDIAKIDPESDFDDFDLRGGAYQDNRADLIWSDFFGVDVSGEKSSKDQSDNPGGKQNAETLENEAEMYIRHHRFNHVTVNFEGHDNGQGQAWGTWDAYLDFELDGEKFVKYPEDRELNNRNYTDYTSHEKKRETNLVMYLQNLHDDIQSVSVERADSQYVKLSFKLTDPNGDRRMGEGQLHQFEHFLDRLSRVDDQYNDIEEHLWFWFSHNGYIENTAKSAAEQYTFRHFTMEASAFKQNPKYPRYKGGAQNSYEIASEWVDIGDMSGMTIDDLKRINFNFSTKFIPLRAYPIASLPKFAQRLSFKVKTSSPLTLKLLNAEAKMAATDRLIAQWDFIVDYNEDAGLAKKTMAGISVIDREWYRYVEVLKQWWLTVKPQITKG